MDHYHPTQSGQPPEEPQNSNIPYPVNGDPLFQTPFTPPNTVQVASLDHGSTLLPEDDTKEYIPSSSSSSEHHGVSPTFYSGFQSEVPPSTPYPVDPRDMTPESYRPTESPEETYKPLPEENHPMSTTQPEFPPNGSDPTYWTTFPHTTNTNGSTSPNMVQGQPPMTGQSGYVAPHPTPVASPYGSQPPYPPQTPYNSQPAFPIQPTHSSPPNLTTAPHSVVPPRDPVHPEEPTHTSPVEANPYATQGHTLYVETPSVSPVPSREFETTDLESLSTPTMDNVPLSHVNKPQENFITPFIQEATPDAVLNLWKRVLDILSTKLSPVCIENWFYKEKGHETGSTTVQPVLPVSFQGDTFTLMTSDSFVKEMFEQSFSANVSQALQDLVNNPIKVVIKLNHAPVVLEEVHQENYNINFTFDNFIESKDNETAYQFAKKIAESETVEFNPFFIYGQSGLGKTHLVCAIANAKKAQMEEKKKIQFEQTGTVGKKFKIAYITGLEWIQEWIQAIQLKKTYSFREKYADCDLFILDDVQFLATRDNTQEELFNLFDNMTRFHRQVVFTSDCHPSKLNGFHQRLTTRFAQGLSQEVKFPDLETCIAITRSKAEQKGLMLPDYLIELIAENTKSSVREIEGMVNKVFAKCDMSSDSVLDKETIMSLVKDIVVDNKESGPTPKDFIRTVSTFFNVKESDLIDHGRTKQIVRVRNIAIFIIRENTGLSLKEIGELFSGRDHSTIKNSLTNIESTLKKEEKSGTNQTKIEIEDIIQRAQSAPTEQDSSS